MITLPILHTGSDQSPTETSFLLLITNTASFCEKTAVSAIGSRTIWTPFDWMWQFERCRSEAQKGKKEWHDLIFWLWHFLSTNTLLNRRGQGNNSVLTASISNTAGCVPQPFPRQDLAQLQRKAHSWKVARTCLHHFCSSWSDQSLHTTQRTLTPQIPRYHHISRAQFCASRMPLWQAGIQLLHDLKHYEMKKKYIPIIGGEAIQSVDISQYTLFISGIRNFFLTLLYCTVLSTWL